MQAAERISALPEYLDRDKRDKEGNAISPKRAYPVELYFCTNCRYVEMFAA